MVHIHDKMTCCRRSAPLICTDHLLMMVAIHTDARTTKPCAHSGHDPGSINSCCCHFQQAHDFYVLGKSTYEEGRRVRILLTGEEKIHYIYYTTVWNNAMRMYITFVTIQHQ